MNFTLTDVIILLIILIIAIIGGARGFIKAVLESSAGFLEFLAQSFFTESFLSI